MSSPADQLDAQFRDNRPPPPGLPPGAPPTSLTVAPPSVPSAYMAHTDAMKGAAASEQLDAMFPAKPTQAQPKPPEGAATPAPAAPATVPGGQVDQAVQAEMQRLQTPDTVGARLDKQYGKQLPNVLRARAEENLGITQPTVLDKVGAVASDIGEGIIEQPRSLAHAYTAWGESMMNLAKTVGDFTNQYFPALQVVGKGAPRIVMPAERAADPSLPPSLADDMHFPQVGEPASTTAKITSNIEQFTIGMASAGGQLKNLLNVPSAVSAWGARGMTAVKGFLGAFEAFDGPKADLSNIVQSHPALANPVNQLLAVQGDDSNLVRRLKGAAEGVVVGQALDGLVGGIRYLRAVNQAKEAAENVQGLEAGNEDLGDNISPPTKAPSGLASLGDDSKPLVSANFDESRTNVAKAETDTSGMTPEQVAAMGQTPEKEPGVFINFSKIDSADDVKNAMGQLADAFKDNINQARRGVQTFEDTKLGADATDAWQVLMSRRVGQPLNAEESLAARQLWATSAAKTYDLAQIAVETPTPENLFAFRKMLATHAAIQEQVIAARTETARALSSWRIPAGEQGFRMDNIMQALKQDTGPNSDGLSLSLNLAQRVKALQEAGDVGGLNGFVEKSVYAKTRDAALEAWTNGLLTSPLTHVKVIASNAATIALRIVERGIAEKLSGVLGDTDGVAPGEAAAQYAGLVSGLKDSFRYAGRAANAFLNEEPLPPLGNDPLSNAIKAAKSGTYSAGEDMPDHRLGGAISSEAFNMSQSGWAGQGVDLMGQLVRSPGRALTAEHDFFRSIGYRMELSALATRQATQEVQMGKIPEEALGSRAAEIVANPPPSVTIGSIDAMKYQTFTDAPGKLANLIEQARTDFPMLRVVLPFYKIPARILSFTFERTPIAPLMSSYQANIAAGGARASLARAQMGLGTAMMLATADAVMSGHITGSGPPDKATRGAMQNTGWLPYSMKVGDHWVQYNKLETAGSSMAMAADIVETARNYHAAINGDNPDMEKLAVAGALSVAQNVTSKTYLQGLSNMFEAMANPKTEGEAVARSYAGSVVPAGVAAIDRMTDPYQRTVYSMMDAIKARTPGWSETLPPRRDVWGDPIEHASDMGKAYDLLSPFATRKPADSPIDKEIVKQGFNVNLPQSNASFGQGAMIDLRKDPAMYSRYVELAGNGYKDPAWGLGAKDLLNQIVSGNHPLSSVYNMKSDGPQGGKAAMVHGLMNQYREGARQQLLQENPKLQSQVDEMRANVNALKAPQ